MWVDPLCNASPAEAAAYGRRAGVALPWQKHCKVDETAWPGQIPIVEAR
jgi:hypothetical protein